MGFWDADGDRMLERILSMCCMGTALILLITFANYYWQLYNSAVAYNADPLNALPASPDRLFLNKHSESLELTFELRSYLLKYPFREITPYDACGGDMTNPNFSTDWLMIYHFNAIMYTIMMTFACISYLGEAFGERF